MKKSRKSKIVLFSVLGLASISLATVGFATWVISGITPTGTQNINVSAGDVVDNTLSAAISDPELKVRFDNVASPSDGELANGESEFEDLIFGFKVTITGEEEKIGGIKFTFKLDSNFETLFTSNYLKFVANSPTSLSKEFSVNKTCVITTADVTFADTNETTGSKITYSSKVFTCRFAFKWGSVFGGVNPSTAYKNASDKAAVISNLKAFDTAVGNIKATTWMSVVVTPLLA